MLDEPGQERDFVPHGSYKQRLVLKIYGKKARCRLCVRKRGEGLG